MIVFSESELLFLELYRAGMWQNTVNLQPNKKVDWGTVLAIAQKQTMIGIVGEAFLSLPHELIDKKWRMAALANLVEIEDHNLKMNRFLPVLFKRLKREGWHVWLLKGQGVGLCYSNPIRRVAGDIDVFFLYEDEYHKACRFFGEHLPKKDIKAVNEKTLDYEFDVDGLYVELHGSVVTVLNSACNRNFKYWKNEIIKDEVSMFKNELKGIPLPPCRFDSVFIFLHTVRHYFGGGIGLRQVSDWMRYVFCHYEQIQMDVLVSDIKLLGLEKIWKVFASMAVDFLGYPQDRMPLYDKKYSKQGKTVLRYILDSGNFGQFDESTKTNTNVYLIQRLKAFNGHLKMKLRNIWMFPEESVYGIPNFIIDGIKRT